MRLGCVMNLGGVLSLFVIAGIASAAGFEMTPTIQAELDRLKTVVMTWAADPVIVKAVVEQNSQGPIVGMDNAKWKVTRRTDPMVKALQANPAGQFLKSKIEASQELFNEAFLNADHGEKVAFIEKTTSYIHRGQPKFDVPFTTGTPWQGQDEFDESTQTYAIQLSVPVLAEGKAVGALVVGVNLSRLEKVAKQ